MTVFAYRCRLCDRSKDSHVRDVLLCVCGNIMQRDYSSVRFGSVQHGHFNSSVGRYVDGKRGFSEALKRKSEEQTLRTGVLHNYQPIDASDPKAVGVTEEGMESTRRQQVAVGKLETKRYM